MRNTLLLFLLLLVSPLAGATCAIGTFFKSCSNDTIDELIVDNTTVGVVVVSMALDDESNLTSGTGSCTLYSPGLLQTPGLALRSTHPQFDKAYQTLLTAASSFLRVKIIVVTGPTGSCDIAEVSLTP